MRVLADYRNFDARIAAAGTALFRVIPARMPSPKGLLSGVPSREAYAADSGYVIWRIVTPTALDILGCRFVLQRSIYTPSGALVDAGDSQEIPAARIYRDPQIRIALDNYVERYTLQVSSNAAQTLRVSTWLWLDDGVQMVLEHEVQAAIRPAQLDVLTRDIVEIGDDDGDDGEGIGDDGEEW